MLSLLRSSPICFPCLPRSPAATDFVVVVNGKVCRPCARLYPLLQEAPAPLLPPAVLSAEYRGEGLALLKRTENGATDIGGGAGVRRRMPWGAACTLPGLPPRLVVLQASHEFCMLTCCPLLCLPVWGCRGDGLCGAQRDAVLDGGAGQAGVSLPLPLLLRCCGGAAESLLSC